MIFFIGIKGAGMASLACMLHDIGQEVMGSDIDKHIFTQEQLEARHIEMVPFMVTDFQPGWTVVVGNAFLDDFNEVKKAHASHNVRVIRYHHFLGELMAKYNSIAVSGSHGKTTTTSLVAHMLTYHHPSGYLIGDGQGHLSEDAKDLVVEACEYRHHFLAYNPHYAIITNIDWDHVDYFKTLEDYIQAFQAFSETVSQHIIACGDDKLIRSLTINRPITYYGFESNNDVIAKDVRYDHGFTTFNLVFKGENKGEFKLSLVGDHMVLNALAAITLGLLLDIPLSDIQDSLKDFKGAKRRFVQEVIHNDVFIDDYAHHPTEIKMTVLAAKQAYPHKKIVAVFKPHRVSRLVNFVDEFTSALSLADEVYLVGFNSIDDYEEGYTQDIHYLSDRIKGSQVIDEDMNAAHILAKHSPAVYLFMSSKDIYVLADLLKTIV
ncbi:MAG: UDP-N-acetylmuramate--L-alanine ligase [Erysipelothrix sp.]|jgi:UDP-N-acetylmuramate--alanine ligase|nr:UDP-N-acetylmuramate--L-alanine ligase [Erysipelothrix sp.]